jgi:hypothetical protein
VNHRCARPFGWLRKSSALVSAANVSLALVVGALHAYVYYGRAIVSPDRRELPALVGAPKEEPMGHIRLLTLPKSRKWEQVVNFIDEGADVGRTRRQASAIARIAQPRLRGVHLL